MDMKKPIFFTLSLILNAVFAFSLLFENDKDVSLPLVTSDSLKINVNTDVITDYLELLNLGI